MTDLFTIQNLMTLLMLTLLQAVLGFDNLLYISIESKRVTEDKQSMVRRWGIGLAIGLRIVLLVTLLYAIESFQEPLFKLQLGSWVTGDFNVHALIVLGGGGFIIYTAMKEISHMLVIHDIGHEENASGAKRSVSAAVAWIVVMNLVFSFDSILSAMALAKSEGPTSYPMPKIVVMALAVIVSGLMMILLADRVAEFLKKNRMYEVLGLFVLFIVGIMLVSEGGHLAHLHLFGYVVEPMAKSTFYFVIAVLVLVDIIQGRYQKKLLAERAGRRHTSDSHA